MDGAITQIGRRSYFPISPFRFAVIVKVDLKAASPPSLCSEASDDRSGFGELLSRSMSQGFPPVASVTSKSPTALHINTCNMDFSGTGLLSKDSDTGTANGWEVSFPHTSADLEYAKRRLRDCGGSPESNCETRKSANVAVWLRRDTHGRCEWFPSATLSYHLSKRKPEAVVALITQLMIKTPFQRTANRSWKQ